MGVTSSGALEESKPWPLWKSLALIPVGVAATSLFIVSGFFWAGVGVVMIVLIYRQWRS